MNKLFSIVLIIMLSLPVIVRAADDLSVLDIQTLPIVNTIDDDIELEQEEPVDYKVPIEKKKIVKKFLLAMGAVAGSSFLIFFGLTAYNRVRENLLKPHTADGSEISLETPENLEEAVKVFLNKTNWN